MRVTIRGGLFQDFAPSFFHLQYVLLPLLSRMGLSVDARMVRPGYVPQGQGILELTVTRGIQPPRAVVLLHRGELRRIWGIALASHLAERRVPERMAQTAQAAFARAGYAAEIQVVHDRDAAQPGAALAAFADLKDQAPAASTGTPEDGMPPADVRLGADWAGARGRTSEGIAAYVASQLLDDLRSEATLDRWAADQIIPFAALAAGESRFRIPAATDHVRTNAWLAETFLGAKVTVGERELTVAGIGFSPP